MNADLSSSVFTADSIAETVLRVAIASAHCAVSQQAELGPDLNVARFLSQLEVLAEQAAEHIRTMITGDLATVTDSEGVAREWNEAILFAIQTVEGA